jgi:hypothetical protein
MDRIQTGHQSSRITMDEARWDDSVSWLSHHVWRIKNSNFISLVAIFSSRLYTHLKLAASAQFDWI